MVVVLIISLSGRCNAQSGQTKKAEVDLEKLAKSLVNECADIQEGEIVFVNGGVRDLELLEDIVVNVRKNGAFPLLTIDSDRLTRKMYTEVPKKYDKQLSQLNYNLVEMMDAQITISSSETPDLLADIPPERFATINKTNQPINDLYLSKTIKSVNLGNGLYPTKAKATQFNISLEKLTELFWKGISVDYNVLEKNGKKLQSILESGQELEITHINGTNFKVNISNRPSFISDGIISKEDLKKGAAGTAVYLPAGEVYTTPEKGTANGKIIVENFFLLGQTIKGLELIFENGKLVDMDAKSGIKQIKAHYKAQEKGIEDFSLIDFGINSDIEVPAGSSVLSYVPAGIITVGIGNNIWAGGDNNTSIGLNFFLPGCTVKIDGETVVEEGQLSLK
jgi:leucyl aminopeptidase (aminopeptidase T)